MPRITWKREYSVGVTRIDEQHKKIAEFLNDFFQAIFRKEGRGVFEKLVKEIAAYADYHFATEEFLLKENHHPQTSYEEQVREHAGFHEEAAELQGRVAADDPAVAVEVLKLLTRWLGHHILSVDKKYGAFLNAKGIF